MKKLLITSALLTLIVFNVGLSAERDCLNPKNYAEKLLCKKDQVKNKIFKSKENNDDQLSSENKTTDDENSDNTTTEKLKEGSKSVWKKFKDATKGIREMGGKNIGEPG